MKHDIFVSSDGGARSFGGAPRPCLDPQAALALAGPGTTLRFFGEHYSVPIVVKVSGEPFAPVRLLAEPGAIFDGGQHPHGVGNPRLAPNEQHFHAIRLYHCAHVEIAGFEFRNCWPTAIFGRGARNILIRDISASNGQFFVYLRRGWTVSGARAPTHGVTLRDVKWTQDPERRMWRGDATWDNIKDWKHPDSMFNGAIVGSWMAAGDILIERCWIEHAFNGVRLDAETGANPGSANVDIRITDCDFRYIRDNAIEPEKTALGWWVWGCRMRNVHAAFSLHGFRGGGVYIWGNVICNIEKPADPHRKPGGKILKFEKDDTVFVEQPICFLHNSVVLKSAYSKAGTNALLTHANNAIACLDPERPLFNDDKGRLQWRADWSWLGDVCDHVHWPDGFPPAWGFSISGTRAQDFLAAPTDCRLKARSGGPIAPGHDGRPTIPPRPVTIPMPDGTKTDLENPGALVGAIQRNGRPFAGLSPRLLGMAPLTT